MTFLRNREEGKRYHAVVRQAGRIVAEGELSGMSKKSKAGFTFAIGPLSVAYSAARRYKYPEGSEIELDDGQRRYRFIVRLRGKERYVTEKASTLKRSDKTRIADRSLRKRIVEGIGRAFWVMFWLQREEEKGRSFGGQRNIEDLAPRTSSKAKRHAEEIATDIEQRSKTTLDRRFSERYPREDPELFGWYLGMEALGSGVAWSDDHDDHGLEIPHTEYYE